MRITIGCLAAASIAFVSARASAETCSLYQKWKKDHGQGNCSAFPSSSYFEVTPVVGNANSTFFARKVPRCKDGTETCGSYEVRSLDGTRAFYYVDPADNGVEASNRWIIAFEGGGACGEMQGVNSATACMTGTEVGGFPFNGYDVAVAGDLDYKEMTTKHANGVFTIDDRRIGNGILSPSAPSQFGGVNRVIVNKSNFDRFMGNGTMATPYNGDSIELYFHGRRVVSSMLKDLARSNGVFSVGRSCPSFSELECQTVEDFSQATEVTVVGESGGAGGLIHNMEWLKAAILNRAPNAKVAFLLASRMIPWLEAEAHWGGVNGIWDGVYSGISTVAGNVNTPTPNAVVQYSNATFQPNGIVRNLIKSWGNPVSVADPFLDAGCKAVHGNADWRCFDEGHVALYHMDEDVFWFESLLDGVHNRSSPSPFAETADFGNGPVDLTSSGGFIFDPSGSWMFSQDRVNRVIYTADSMLQSHNGAGSLAFYQPFLNCHTTIFSAAWWSDQLTKNGGNITSLQDAFVGWRNAIGNGAPQDRAWIQDASSTDPVAWTNGIYGGGWTTSSNACPQ